MGKVRGRSVVPAEKPELATCRIRRFAWSVCHLARRKRSSRGVRRTGGDRGAAARTPNIPRYSPIRATRSVRNLEPGRAWPDRRCRELSGEGPESLGEQGGPLCPARFSELSLVMPADARATRRYSAIQTVQASRDRSIRSHQVTREQLERIKSGLETSLD